MGPLPSLHSHSVLGREAWIIFGAIPGARESNKRADYSLDVFFKSIINNS